MSKEEIVSTDLKADEAIEHIENTPKKELNGFITDSEDRVTVLEAYDKATMSMAARSRQILKPLIKEGEHTRQELKEILLEEDITETTADVILTDSKNPKYNQFEKLVIEDEDGCYTFE
ncbi:hypothetical protein LQ318_08485 [Aliifodinibius salicampi]|uniref:Uncharacterized protein n=1 Tax=Fodinibius salicampi TaxID=1920655 RepID=A0ABT3PYM0_9BACT|nr:hypothetical protein [Fodinibius salicampi]MCW9712940.1 hypothetical protein [Fodinibius salicampi]